MREEWNIPSSYNELVTNGDAVYSILGVLTNDNMDSMRRFIDAVDIPEDVIECDDGTQVILTHTDSNKWIVIDAHGLGDFYDSGFDVAVRPRGE